MRVQDAQNDTAKNGKIGSCIVWFGIIGSVTNPFCDSCNIIRLRANGHLKNGLFCISESYLLTAIREGKPIAPVVQNGVTETLHPKISRIVQT
ncbi:hypothetical protein [Flagellimonas sp.]|uniref:hypothetical protein n=1 Tax=Flagellimonas sp. TaxID=2058762 RepID=UPI003BAB4FE3